MAVVGGQQAPKQRAAAASRLQCCSTAHLRYPSHFALGRAVLLVMPLAIWQIARAKSRCQSAHFVGLPSWQTQQ